MAKLTSAERQARYRKKHPEKIKAYQKSDARKEQCKKYRETHDTHPMNDPQQEAYKKYRASEKFRVASVNSHLKRKYGITLDDYNGMLAEQEGKCKICGKVGTGLGGQTTRMPLVVDHNHTTGEVRGLLCNSCNTGLGMFKENTEALMNAISYLESGA